jgi:hypothetical protein
VKKSSSKEELRKLLFQIQKNNLHEDLNKFDPLDELSETDMNIFEI